MNLKTLYFPLAMASIAFVLCSLQFYELSKISDRATLEAHKSGEVLATANLPRVLTHLELVEKRNALNNSNQSLTQSAEWSEAKETLSKYSARLKLKNDFHSDISLKMSRIQLRNSIIVLVLVLSSSGTLLGELLYSKRIKKNS
jgi:hypothetical protein